MKKSILIFAWLIVSLILYSCICEMLNEPNTIINYLAAIITFSHIVISYKYLKYTFKTTTT